METFLLILTALQLLLLIFNLGVYLFTRDKHTQIISLLWVIIFSISIFAN